MEDIDWNKRKKDIEDCNKKYVYKDKISHQNIIEFHLNLLENFNISRFDIDKICFDKAKFKIWTDIFKEYIDNEKNVSILDYKFWAKILNEIFRLENTNGYDNIDFNAIREYLKNHIGSTVKTNDNNKEKKLSTYQSLFFNAKNPQIVKDIFEKNGITKNGKYIDGEKSKKNKLFAAYCALKEKQLIIAGSKTSQATIFYNEFGLLIGKNKKNSGDYTTDRTFRTFPKIDIDYFKKIFKELQITD